MSDKEFSRIMENILETILTYGAIVMGIGFILLMVRICVDMIMKGI